MGACKPICDRLLAKTFSDIEGGRAHSNYVNRQEVQSLGLVTVDGNSFILRADDTTTLSPGGKGRNSFRIISNNQYGTHVSV
jgi:hypothetical protein